MGFRYRKSKKILPGTRMNISKSGVSVSTKLGGGLSYRTQLVGGKKKKRKPSTNPVPLRLWWLVVAVVFIMAGGPESDPETQKIATALAVIGLFMLITSIVTFVVHIVRKVRRQNPEQTEDQE